MTVGVILARSTDAVPTSVQRRSGLRVAGPTLKRRRGAAIRSVAGGAERDICIHHTYNTRGPVVGKSRSLAARSRRTRLARSEREIMHIASTEVISNLTIIGRFLSPVAPLSKLNDPIRIHFLFNGTWLTLGRSEHHITV